MTSFAADPETKFARRYIDICQVFPNRKLPKLRPVDDPVTIQFRYSLEGTEILLAVCQRVNRIVITIEP
jgi:hypothetical protein